MGGDLFVKIRYEQSSQGMDVGKNRLSVVERPPT